MLTSASDLTLLSVDKSAAKSSLADIFRIVAVTFQHSKFAYINSAS